MILHNTGKMLMCISSWLTQILVTFSVDSPPISGVSIRKIRQHISQLLMSNTSLIVWSAVLLRMVTIFLDTTSSNIDQIAKSKCKLHWTERKFFVSEKIHSFLKPLMQIPRHQNLVGIGYIYRIDHIRCWNLNPNIFFFIIIIFVTKDYWLFECEQNRYPKKISGMVPRKKKVYLLCILWEIDMSGVARWFLEIRLENMWMQLRESFWWLICT